MSVTDIETFHGQIFFHKWLLCIHLNPKYKNNSLHKFFKMCVTYPFLILSSFISKITIFWSKYLMRLIEHDMNAPRIIYIRDWLLKVTCIPLEVSKLRDKLMKLLSSITTWDLTPLGHGCFEFSFKSLLKIIHSWQNFHFTQQKIEVKVMGHHERKTFTLVKHSPKGQRLTQKP